MQKPEVKSRFCTVSKKIEWFINIGDTDIVLHTVPVLTLTEDEEVLLDDCFNPGAT